jgi:hypothetical protein
MKVEDILAGLVDLHVHSSPDIDQRRFDDIELARHAASAGWGGLLIKSHQGSTVERAYLVQRIVPELQVFGGLVLNGPVGGLNPAAVRVALALGAKQIWMPTRDAANHRRAHGKQGGITLAGAREAVEEILQLIAAAGAALGTGHLAPEEGMELARMAHGAGVRHIFVTHPEWEHTFYSLAQQRDLAGIPGVYFERCFVSTTHRCGYTPFSRIEEAIAEVGAAKSILSTDLGQLDTPAPADGMRMYVERLLATGFSADEVRMMIVDNPLRVLGA